MLKVISPPGDIHAMTGSLVLYLNLSRIFLCRHANLFLAPAFSTAAVDCLAEIASLPPSDIPANYQPAVHAILVSFIAQLAQLIPREVGLVEAYESGSDEYCLFVQRLALFLSTFLKSYLPFFESADPSVTYANQEHVLEAILYMIRISEIKDDELFKTCLEFW
jgi:exportin-1